MPRGDGIGPMGMGSMTGRRAGYCAGRGSPGFASSGRGPGFGHRGRGGRGRRNMFHATGLTGWQRTVMNAGQTPTTARAETAQTEKQSLEAGIAAMQAQLDDMKKRLAEIETSKT
jgi:hypothetical protein